jgi:hypothetical protein
MKRILALVLAASYFTQSAHSTAHAIIWDGTEIYILSDGLRSGDPRLPTESVCKQHIYGNTVVIAWGHMSDGKILEYPDGHLERSEKTDDFEMEIDRVMTTTGSRNLKYQLLTKAASELLVKDMEYYDSHNLKSSKDQYSLGGAFIWVENGTPEMRVFNVNVGDWKSRLVTPDPMSSIFHLRVLHLYILPRTHFLNYVEDVNKKYKNAVRAAPEKLALESLHAIGAAEPTNVGPPYAVLRIKGNGSVEYVDPNSLCAAKYSTTKPKAHL